MCQYIQLQLRRQRERAKKISSDKNATLGSRTKVVSCDFITNFYWNRNKTAVKMSQPTPGGTRLPAVSPFLLFPILQWILFFHTVFANFTEFWHCVNRIKIAHSHVRTYTQTLITQIEKYRSIAITFIDWHSISCTCTRICRSHTEEFEENAPCDAIQCNAQRWFCPMEKC